MTETPAPDFDDPWILAQDLFLSGRPGEAICRDLSLAPSTFWKRAARDGWLRRDRPAGPSQPREIDPTAPVHDQAGALDTAWRRFCAALDDGWSTEAARWGRIHAQLKASALAEARAGEEDRRLSARQQGDQIVAHTAAVARAARAELALIKAAIPTSRRVPVEKVESESRDSPPSIPDRPLNRAERRRQRRGRGP